MDEIKKPVIIHGANNSDTPPPPPPDNPEDTPKKEKLNPKAVTLNLRNFPVVVLYGPPSVGKTSILGSLNFHVNQTDNYGIRFSSDTGVVQNAPKDYEDEANKFLASASGEYMVDGSVDFILVSVQKNEKLAFYCLEAPGEHFFNPLKPEREALHYRYLSNLFSAKNKKIVCYVFTPNMFESNAATLLAYKNNIEASMRSLSRNDEVIVIATKVNEKNERLIDSDIVKSWFEPSGVYRDFGQMFKTSRIKNIKIIPYASHRILPDHESTDGTNRPGIAQLNGEYQLNLMRLLLSKTKEPSWWQTLFSRK